MKKLMSLLLVWALILSATACGSKTNSQPTEDTLQSKPAEQVDTKEEPSVAVETEAIAEDSEDTLVFSYQGIQIPMNSRADAVLEQLGDPVSYTEEASCAFEGLDKTYFFGSFYLQTYPAGEVDYIYCVWLMDDTVATGEGICIGAAQAEVEAAYGTDGYNGENAYIMTDGDTKLTVIMENGMVSSIQYDAVVE